MLKKLLSTALLALVVTSQTGCVLVQGFWCCAHRLCCLQRSMEYHCEDCGEQYCHEWFSDPPACCDPCDRCGNYMGPRHHGQHYGPPAGHHEMPMDGDLYDATPMRTPTLAPEELPPARPTKRPATTQRPQQRMTHRNAKQWPAQPYYVEQEPRRLRAEPQSQPRARKPQATARARSYQASTRGPQRTTRPAPYQEPPQTAQRRGQPMRYQDRDVMLQQIQQQAQQRGRGAIRDPDSGEMLPSPGMRIGDAVVVDSKLSESQIVDEAERPAPTRTAARPKATTKRVSTRVR